MHGGPSAGYRWYKDLQDEMFTERMGSENSGPQALQDIFFKKERPNRKKEGRKVHWQPVLPL